MRYILKFWWVGSGSRWKLWYDLFSFQYIGSFRVNIAIVKAGLVGRLFVFDCPETEENGGNMSREVMLKKLCYYCKGVWKGRISFLSLSYRCHCHDDICDVISVAVVAVDDTTVWLGWVDDIEDIDMSDSSRWSNCYVFRTLVPCKQNDISRRRMILT